MSSWIKSYQALMDHTKTRKLARRVGGVPMAIGHLHCLWWWCLDYAPDGDLTKHSAEDIAIAAEWDGDPQEIVRHLTECGFLDGNGAGLQVHDWWEHGEAIIRQREENRDRARRSYEKKRGSPEDSTRSLRAVCAQKPKVYAQSTGLDRKIDRKKDLTENRPVDNSTVRPVSVEERICWRCAKPISGDDVLDDKCVDSRKGLRHVECAP